MEEDANRIDIDSYAGTNWSGCDPDELAARDLVRWRAEGSAALSTLELRAAAHAAERAGDASALRELESVVEVREAKGETA